MTRQSAFWLSISFLLCLRGKPSVVSFQYQTGRQRDERVVTELSHLDIDFENGILDPWIEESLTSGVQWKIENQISPWDLNNKAPPQLNGKSYLRVDRGTNFRFGVAVLRSPAFSLPSSESDVSFSFWIRSKWPQYTNLELYLAENGNERLVLSLNNYSLVTNQAWESQSISLIGSSSSTFSLVFYAYCGIDPEDAVAIDDIRFTSNQFTVEQTTPAVETSTITQSTATNPESTVMTTTILTTLTIPSEPTTTTTTPTSTTTVTTEVPTTAISVSFTCPDTSEKKYPDPENPCNGKYYQCSGGIATLTNCQENLIFNSKVQLCTPCSLVPACAKCDQ